jgi:Rrf2 family protein
MPGVFKMHFSAQEAYGLRCVLQLAKGHGCEAVTARQISELEFISLDYVHKLLGILKRKGLIVSTRGIKGGFRLKKEPAKITVCHVLQLLSSELDSDGHCVKFARKNVQACHGAKECEVKPFLDAIFRFYKQFSSRVTIQDLIDRKIPPVQVVF